MKSVIVNDYVGIASGWFDGMPLIPDMFLRASNQITVTGIKIYKYVFDEDSLTVKILL